MSCWRDRNRVRSAVFTVRRVPNMNPVFKPSANLWTSLVLWLLAAALLGSLLLLTLWPRSAPARHQDWFVAQPVPFSHEHHVAGLGIDCRFCHTAVEVSASAGLPPTYTCMTCHSQIWTNAALLAPVRQSLVRNQPLHWHRITDLPEYVYFNHSIHIAKGVGCESCHGDVERMPLMRKARSLTMAFCLDCHRNPGPRLRPPEAIYDTEWQRSAATPSPQALLARYRIPSRRLTDCSICHR